MSVYSQPKRELARLDRLRRSGHPDTFGIKLAIQDWIYEDATEVLMVGDNPAHLPIREFPSGANRDTDNGKPDYHGFMSPLVIRAFGAYMHKHRLQSNGAMRDSDNWKKGIPKPEYMKSLFRHFVDVWLFHDGYVGRGNIEDALCGIIFNASGYLFELEKQKLCQPTCERANDVGL